jgi:PAS domain-containing protein
LNQFVEEALRLSRELNLPLLKHLKLLPEKELLAMARERSFELLNAFVENKVDEYNQKSLENWKSDRIPLIAKDKLEVEDINLATHIRKQTLLKFIPLFTSDAEKIIALVSEIDNYFLTIHSETVKICLEIEREMLSASNQEFEKNQRLYQSMIKEVKDYAILLLDKNGIIQNWNDGAEKIKGYKAEEIIGKSFRVFYQREDQEVKLPEKLIEQATQEEKHCMKGGE